jgi:hypothetical protein
VYYARSTTGKKPGSQDPPRELPTHLRLSRLTNHSYALDACSGQASHPNPVVLFRR